MAHAFSTAPAAPRHGGLDDPAVRQARIDLAACFRMAARLGLQEGICNHFSAVVPGRPDLFLVNPYGWAFGEITASRLLICDFEGGVVAGEGVPEATAFYIHARLHKHNPRAVAAFHTHMPYATALAMLEGEPLVWAGQTALKFYGRTVVDEDYNGLALDAAEGDRIAAAMGSADIALHAQPRRDGDGALHRGGMGRCVLLGAGGPGAMAGPEHGARAEAGADPDRAGDGPADAGRRPGKRPAASGEREAGAGAGGAGVRRLARRSSNRADGAALTTELHDDSNSDHATYVLWRHAVPNRPQP